MYFLFYTKFSALFKNYALEEACVSKWTQYALFPWLELSSVKSLRFLIYLYRVGRLVEYNQVGSVVVLFTLQKHDYVRISSSLYLIE